MRLSREYLIPVLVSIGGTAGLAIPYLQPRTGDDVTAILFVPSLSGTDRLREIAALNVPIRDILWNGHLAVLDVSSLPGAERIGLARLLNSPAMQMSITSKVLCTN
ncbi:hypothetical protein [Roseinatronobacter sp. NSM]|uniref:hypothetical protein n=1 Tax=Roseinatronobacter sp. NSM TaxID=3457785 RepID=UPI004035CFCC